MGDAMELCFTPAIELRRLPRTGNSPPSNWSRPRSGRIERLNPLLNAYLTVTADAAREQARAAEARAMRGKAHGLVGGLPYAIKDLGPAAGVRTTYGSRWFEHHVPAKDGAVAARLKAACGSLLDETNTTHFGYKDMCDNPIGPPCRNPWQLDRISGASSGGATAALPQPRSNTPTVPASS